MLLVVSNTHDQTTDLLMDRLDAKSVFRLNTDIFARYAFSVSTQGWSVRDPAGREITSDNLVKLYWRKPIYSYQVPFPAADAYCQAELLHVLNHIIVSAWLQRKVVLVEPWADRRVNKLRQLQVAGRHFRCPEHRFSLNHELRKPEEWKHGAIVKSLTSTEVSPESVLYASSISAGDLDPRFPWLLQEEICATDDLTVLFVRGRCWAFTRSREDLAGRIDWREKIFEEAKWLPYLANLGFEEAIRRFMAEVSLDFGRLDFLVTADEAPVFLEVNPNGQFAWLDVNDAFGILSAVINEIHPATAVHPIQPRVV